MRFEDLWYRRWVADPDGDRSKARANSERRAEELTAIGDHAGVAVWHRIADAIEQLTNTIPPGPLH
jgi:hypothetical protein